MRGAFDNPVDHVTFRGRRLGSASWHYPSLVLFLEMRACKHDFLFRPCVKRPKSLDFLLSVAGTVLSWPLMMSLQHGRTWGWWVGGGTCQRQFANAKKKNQAHVSRLGRAQPPRHRKKRDLVHFWRRCLQDPNIHPLLIIHNIPYFNIQWLLSCITLCISLYKQNQIVSTAYLHTDI